jgi:HEAT repeat protein
MTMKTMRKLGGNFLSALVLGASALLSATAFAGPVTPYEGIPADQAEAITTPDHLISIVQSGAPTAIWQALEHAETVECMQCIPFVAPLLYNVNAKNREIAAWWLRRRIFGVFGPGEVYSQTVATLSNMSQSAANRSYAASALGEFLVMNGVQPLATSLLHDPDSIVRAAAASALGRINDDGNGALAAGFSDTDATVRAAAYVAAGKVNSFSDVARASAATGDSDPIVRRVGIELLDEMVATDAADAVLKVAQNDPVSEVRLVACHALGNIGDQSMVPALNAIAQNDSNTQVQDQANIAVLRLNQ